jgi:hypothetical protein
VRFWRGGVGTSAVDGWLMPCRLTFHDMRFCDRLQIQICWDLHGSFFNLWWFPNLLRFVGFFVSGWPFPRRCWPFGGELRAGTYMPRSSFYCLPIKFWLAELFSGLGWAAFTFDSRARVRGNGIFIDLTNIFDKFNFRVLLMLEVLSYVLLLGVHY